MDGQTLSEERMAPLDLRDIDGYPFQLAGSRVGPEEPS